MRGAQRRFRAPEARSSSGEGPKGRSVLAEVQKAPQAQRPAPSCPPSQTPEAASLGSAGPSEGPAGAILNATPHPHPPSTRWLCKRQPRGAGREVAVFTRHPLSSLSSQPESSFRRPCPRTPRGAQGRPGSRRALCRPPSPTRPQALGKAPCPPPLFLLGRGRGSSTVPAGPAFGLRTVPFCNPALDWRTSRWGGLGTSGKEGDW